MSYVLLWIESLVLPLLLVAAWMACTTRMTPRQVFWLAKVPILVALWVGAATALIFVVNYYFQMHETFSFWKKLLLLLPVISSAWLLRGSPLWLRMLLSALVGVIYLLLLAGLTWMDNSLLVFAGVGVIAIFFALWISFARRSGQVFAAILICATPDGILLGFDCYRAATLLCTSCNQQSVCVSIDTDCYVCRWGSRFAVPRTPASNRSAGGGCNEMATKKACDRFRGRCRHAGSDHLELGSGRLTESSRIGNRSEGLGPRGCSNASS